ncbi:hypothetical protein Ancab_036566 [Ancistrocladus abbreviatus]
MQIMEQCVARLDVAMFNAILRESADDIPTDPVSDPITDAKVLPIPAGKSSFGAGAQLKNVVCNSFLSIPVQNSATGFMDDNIKFSHFLSLTQISLPNLLTAQTNSMVCFSSLLIKCSKQTEKL